jgi:hypothetical protein
MSHPGNDHIIDMIRDEMEDEVTEVSSLKLGRDENIEKENKDQQNRIRLERLFEEAVAGIILLRDALDDAIFVLNRNSFDTREVFELLERLKNIRKTMEESK